MKTIAIIDTEKDTVSLEFISEGISTGMIEISKDEFEKMIKETLDKPKVV